MGQIKSQKQLDPSSATERCLLFIEHPLTLWGLAGIAGIVGVLIYTPVLLASGFLVLLGLHRSSALLGLSAVAKSVCYVVGIFGVIGMTWGIEILINNKLRESSASPLPVSVVMSKLGTIASRLDQIPSPSGEHALTKTDLRQAIRDARNEPYIFFADGARVIPKVSYAKRIEFCADCCPSLSRYESWGLNVDLTSMGRRPAINLRHLSDIFISDHQLSPIELDSYSQQSKTTFSKSAPISTAPQNTIAPGETIKFFTICDARFTDTTEASFRSGGVFIYLRLLLMYRDDKMPESKVGVTETWGSYRYNFLSYILCRNHNRTALLAKDLSDL